METLNAVAKRQAYNPRHATVTEKQDLASVLANIVGSDEFTRSRPNLQGRPDPTDKYDTPCLVFLHIQKTAGTSIQNLLSDSYDRKNLFREHSDTLYKHSCGNLSTYSVFAGHFNYDSLSYIPRRVLSIFTFVREPKKRLISLYYFWRAHEPSHTSYHIGMKLANELTIEAFFEDEQIKGMSEVWNHMTWAIMGQRQWRIWQTMLAEATKEDAATEIIALTLRPAILRRLHEFIFVGLQEDFARAINVLFRILEKPQPKAIRADHTLEGLMSTDLHFKKTMEKQPVTSRLDAALDRLIQMDAIVYEEASILYFERLLEFTEISPSNSGAKAQHGGS